MYILIHINKQWGKQLPHTSVIVFIFNLSSVLWSMYPKQIPKKYGEIRVHGCSYTPLNEARCSSSNKLQKERIE